VSAATNDAKSKAASLAKVPSRREQEAALREQMLQLLQDGQTDLVLDTLLGIVDAQRQDIDRLGVRVGHLTRLLYGRRSEKLSKEELRQLALAFGASEEQAAQEDPEVPHAAASESLTDDGKSNKKKRRKHPGRTRLSPELERRVVQTPVPDEERACQKCGAEMAPMGHQDHERIEYVPAQIIVHVERREKLGCKACRGDAVTAERQQVPAIVGRADVSVLAHLIEAKCQDAQPIHRQGEQLKRLGWSVPTNTLYGYWKHGVSLLEPVAHVVQSKVLGGYVVGIDDTKLDFLDEAERSKRWRGHLWAFANAGGMIAYAFTRNWKAEEVAPWLQATEHFVQVDDYKGYASEVVDPDGVQVPLVPPERRLGCGMHIRRRFEKAFKAGDGRAALPMELFRKLYDVEREARGLSPGERQRLRAERSLPLLDQLDAWVNAHKDKLRPTELLAEARSYAEQQRPFFRRCFTDGRFEIDNGDVERGMRRIAMGRRNWLFTGASTGAPRLAVAYTLVESCRRLGLPVDAYLRDVMTKVDGGWPMRRIGELTPEAWGQERGLLLAT
jgi:transposase